jgi:hypothetical protein
MKAAGLEGISFYSYDGLTEGTACIVLALSIGGETNGDDLPCIVIGVCKKTHQK